MNCSLYIIENKGGKYYIGITRLAPENRLLRHNRGDVVSTNRGRPWRLIYTEKHISMASARVREKQLKSWHGGKALKRFLRRAAGSSNGRTHGSEPWNLGSIPGPAALRRKDDKRNLAG